MWDKLPVRYPPENWRAPPEAGYVAAQGMRRDSVDPWRPVRPLELLSSMLPVVVTVLCYRRCLAWLGPSARQSFPWVWSSMCVSFAKGLLLAEKSEDRCCKALSTRSSQLRSGSEAMHRSSLSPDGHAPHS